MQKKNLPHDHGQAMEQQLEHMPGTADFQTVAALFRELGDCSRIRIFWLLCHCEECVINLSAMVDMSSPAVSHHLKLLKKRISSLAGGRGRRSITEPPNRKRRSFSTA